MIRNRLHLSEPPLATLFGIIVGPRGLNFIQPSAWGFTDVPTYVALNCTPQAKANYSRTLSKKPLASSWAYNVLLSASSFQVAILSENGALCWSSSAPL